jgi:hypothetical protein
VRGHVEERRWALACLWIKKRQNRLKPDWEELRKIFPVFF